MQSQYLHPPHTQMVAADIHPLDIHPPPASLADTSACTSIHVATATPTVPFPLVELLPPLPTRMVEIPQTRPTLTAGTVVPLPQASPHPAHCRPPPAPVTQTVPPPAHSHMYSNISAGIVPHLYSDPPVFSTATTTTTSSASHPRMYYNLEHSFVEQVLRGSASTTTVSIIIIYFFYPRYLFPREV